MARSVGRLDWEDMLDELTPQQFAVLAVHQKQNPTGDDREDMRHAHLVSLMLNMFKGEKETPVKPEDALAHFLHFASGKKAKEKKLGPAAAAKMLARR